MNFTSLTWVAWVGLTGSFGIARADALPEQVPAPSDNPTTPAKIELGKQLYFDGRLSKDGTVSCNTCHDVSKGGEDALPTSLGIGKQKGGRNAPTVWNAAFHTVQFWDGRAATLEDQAKGPLTNPIEMGMPSHQAVIDRVKQIPGYVTQFEKAFGPNAVTIDNLARAIASYERTLITRDSAYDRFMKGDKKAMTDAAQRGMKKVQEVGCMSCHMGPNFSGPALKFGQALYQKFPMFPGSEYEKKYELTKDLGRYAVTKAEIDKNKWRVPTWRNVELTGPYFHNGSVGKLDEAVRVMAKMQLNKELPQGDVDDIVAFLKSLTGKRPFQKAPKLPETSAKFF